MTHYLPTLIFIMGFAQWSVLIASVTVPVQLQWRQTFAPLPKLHRQLVWTYALYIFASIFALGLVCVTLNNELSEGGPLALTILAYGATFWAVRLALQGIFDVKPYLTKLWLRLGYHFLTMLFVSFVSVYLLAIALTV